VRGIAKRVGIEAIWLLGGCAVGAWIWMQVASYHENAVDTYWTANGHPPPFSEYAAPTHLIPVFIFAPYVVTVAIRLLRTGTKRLRPAPA